LGGIGVSETIRRVVTGKKAIDFAKSLLKEDLHGTTPVSFDAGEGIREGEPADAVEMLFVMTPASSEAGGATDEFDRILGQRAMDGGLGMMFPLLLKGLNAVKMAKDLYNEKLLGKIPYNLEPFRTETVRVYSNRKVGNVEKMEFHQMLDEKAKPYHVAVRDDGGEDALIKGTPIDVTV
jgi:hypothetical protein